MRESLDAFFKCRKKGVHTFWVWKGKGGGKRDIGGRGNIKKNMERKEKDMEDNLREEGREERKLNKERRIYIKQSKEGRDHGREGKVTYRKLRERVNKIQGKGK